MLIKIISKIIGNRNDRVLKEYSKIVENINSYNDKLTTISNQELLEKTTILKKRLKNGETLDNILAEAFAVIREASSRILNLRHFDVQLLGGIALHYGKIAEMATGEGKTLVATLAAYLNALTGNSVHIVTVNDYLAKRDGNEMGQLFTFMQLSVGIVTADMDDNDKKLAYKSDIIYATNNELGFDYLRDNMAFDLDQKNQQVLNFAIIDEVDSILIDEARTPLIISGPADDYSKIYYAINTIINEFSEQIESGTGKDLVVEIAGDYIKDEKHKNIFLTDDGHIKAERLLIKQGVLLSDDDLYDSKNILLVQHLNSALRAHILYQKDTDYIVKDDEIVIVDEFTGRATPGRRWSGGLHQAIEAKENVSIKKENQTLASITFQNYFRLYKKLSGMTGTAITEAAELNDIYKLEVIIIPSNKPSKRADHSDLVYMSAEEKLTAIAKDVIYCNTKSQPVLIGTSSIENSEIISRLLTKNKIKHAVLNAKQHEKEAEIIAKAGAPCSVTIATNMAGRGTDIVLGGKLTKNNEDKWQELHQQVIDAGGLHIIGTERNESRRVDNQLRGRSGRQGDVGSTRFYLSLEDNLMRIFASEKMAAIMQKLGMKKGESIEHKMINRAIEGAQRKVEAMNYDNRKNLLKYDDIANDQRKIIYSLRNEIITSNNIYDRFTKMRNSSVSDLVNSYLNTNIAEDEWDIEGLYNSLKADFAIDISLQQYLDDKAEVVEIINNILNKLSAIYKTKEILVGEEQMRLFEKAIMLQILDHNWKEHLNSMDYLRQSINLRSYAQKNPIQEYKEESFIMFEELLLTIKTETVKFLSTVNVNEAEQPQEKEQKLSYNNDNNITNQNHKNTKVGRNDPCPCGSGKKYKKCHYKR